MITDAAAAAVFSYNYTLVVAIDDPNATETKKASPKNGANDVVVDNVTDGSGGTTTAPTSPRFTPIPGISFPNMFDQPNNNNGPSLKGVGRSSYPITGEVKVGGGFGAVSCRTTTATATTTMTFQSSPGGSLKALDALELG